MKKPRGPSQREWESMPRKMRLGDAHVQEEVYQQMTACMKAMDEFLNGDKKGADRPWGIVVMMFPYGDVEGRCNYMSNGADRKDIVKLMHEMIARFQADLSGHQHA